MQAHISSKCVFKCATIRKNVFFSKSKPRNYSLFFFPIYFLIYSYCCFTVQLKHYTPKNIRDVPNLAMIFNPTPQNNFNNFEQCNITTLSFSKDFDEPILSPLPSSLVEISFGKQFNSTIAEGCLPSHLTTLK